jgi:hypothetical protein
MLHSLAKAKAGIDADAARINARRQQGLDALAQEGDHLGHHVV